MSETDTILAALADAPRQPAALATLVAVEGSSYRRPGARLLLRSDGLRVGSISGGCLEDDLLIRAQRVLATNRSEVAKYDTTSENDIVWGVGLGCQGIVHIVIEPIPVNRPRWVSVLAANRVALRRTGLSVAYGVSPDGAPGTQLTDETASIDAGGKVFRETILPPPGLTVLGAGDDAQPLARIAREAGWRITILDSRPALATSLRFPEAERIVVGPPEGLAELVELEESTYVVLMTHRYAEDLKLLRVLLARRLAYLGVLGPRKRTERLLARLRADGFSPDPEMLARLHAPVGLDLGSATPATIALSIVAELQCALTGRTPIHLRDRVAPIHG